MVTISVICTASWGCKLSAFDHQLAFAIRQVSHAILKALGFYKAFDSVLLSTAEAMAAAFSNAA